MKQKGIKLTEDEKKILQNHFKYSPLVLIRLKAHTILLKDAGISVFAMSTAMGRDIRSMQRWIKDFLESRLSSIFTGHEANQNAAKLTKEQKTQIKDILSKPPSKFGLPKEFWDVPQLKQYIQAEFGVVYESVQSYHFLLKFSNLSFKYPATFDLHRNDELVEKRLQEIRSEIKPLLEDDNWEVFASDETRMELEAITRRAWLKKGVKTVIKVERKKEAQSYVGFLNQKSFVCEVFEVPWQNQEEILKVFEIFLKNHPDKQICIVWDNARFHKGKIIQGALKAGNLLQRVHLINLAPYAPDTNPIEHVWKTVKEKLSNHQFPTFEHTKQAFKSAVVTQKFNYSI